jgi:hypothetical protein
METLEHVHVDDMPHVLADLARLVKPGTGRVIISVPIEIGPTLLGKQVVRRIAGWRGIGDYRWTERYAPGELLRMLCATASTAIPRQHHELRFPDGSTTRGYAHKGFNWRALRRQLGGCLRVDRTLFSPLGWTKGFLSSQAWMICRVSARSEGVGRAT